MKRKIKIHPGFEFLRDYIESIPENFDSLGTTVYDARNVVRIDETGGRKIVIKSFRRIYLPNRVRYTYFYPSKAQRAFDYARLLLKKDFLTPQPIAYIECFRRGLLCQSFFISEYTDFSPLSVINDTYIPDLKDLLVEFARHTYRLHRENIYHIDYSQGNVLFKKVDNRYAFMLIDNNRMEFGAVPFSKGIRNLERLGLSVEMLASIGKEYARLCGVNEIVSMERLFHYKRRLLQKKSFERVAKRLLKRGQNMVAYFMETDHGV